MLALLLVAEAAIGVAVGVGVPLGAAAVAAALALLAASALWRWCVPVVFAIVLVEGFLTNYFFPATWPPLLKDVVLLCVYLGLVLQAAWSGRFAGLHRRPLAAFVWTLLFLAALAAVQALNVGLPSILVAVVGARNLLFYVPLIWVGHEYVRTRRDAESAVKLVVLPSLLPGAVAIWQYFGGTDALLALGPGFERAVYLLPVSGTTGRLFAQVRAFSTFASPGLFGNYLFAVVSCGLIVLRMRPTAGNLMRVGPLLLVALFAIQASGSRTAMGLVALFGCCYMLYRSRATLLVLGGAFLGALFLVVPRFLGAAAVDRSLDTFYFHEIALRIGGLFFNRLAGAFEVAPMGLGLGSASTAARHVLGGELMLLVESYYVKLQYELGILGVVAFALLSAQILYAQVRAVRPLRDGGLRLLGAGLILFSVIVLGVSTVHTPLDSPPLNVFFWFFVGVALKLPAIDSASDAAIAAQVPTPPTPAVGAPAPPLTPSNVAPTPGMPCSAANEN